MSRYSKENSAHHEYPEEDNFQVVVGNSEDFFDEAVATLNNEGGLVAPLSYTDLDRSLFSSEASALFFTKNKNGEVLMRIGTNLSFSPRGILRTRGGVFTQYDLEGLQRELNRRNIVSTLSEGDSDFHLFVLMNNLCLQVAFSFDNESTKSRSIVMQILELSTMDSKRPFYEFATQPKLRDSLHFNHLLDVYSVLYAHVINALHDYFGIDSKPTLVELCKYDDEKQEDVFTDFPNDEDLQDLALPELDYSEESQEEEREKLTFDDIVCQDEAVWEAKKMVREMERGRKRVTGTDPMKSYLMVGEPGVGKTRLARAIADQTDAEFISIGVTDISQGNAMYWGQAETNLNAKFSQVAELSKKGKKVIVFFDELDTLIQRRGISHEVSQRLMQMFLVNIEKFHSDPNVFILAATNNEENIDPALKRAGRMDAVIPFYTFDTVEKRKTMLLYYAKYVQDRAIVKVFSDDIEWDTVAEFTEGMSMGMEGTPITNGKDLASLLDSVAEDKQARIEDQHQISLMDNLDLWEPITTEELIKIAQKNKKSRVRGKPKNPIGFDTGTQTTTRSRF